MVNVARDKFSGRLSPCVTTTGVPAGMIPANEPQFSPN